MLLTGSRAASAGREMVAETVDARATLDDSVTFTAAELLLIKTTGCGIKLTASTMAPMASNVVTLTKLATDEAAGIKTALTEHTTASVALTTRMADGSVKFNLQPSALLPKPKARPSECVCDATACTRKGRAGGAPSAEIFR